MSYMELLVKPEMFTSFGNAESCLFPFAAQCFNTESMHKVILCHSCVPATKVTQITDGI
jgi:hypothetical protein